MAASVLAVASLFGQDKCAERKPYDCRDKESCRSFEQGQDILKAQTMASYNAPADIQVRGAWDFFVTGSFIYWQPTQDNMELALTNTLYAGVAGASGSFNGVSGNFVQMNFPFEPGFKVGIGMNTDHDNWDLFAEYTWLRENTRTSTNGPATGSLYQTRGFAVTPAGVVLNNNPYNSASQNWTCNLDFLNLEMGRSCYVGRALTVRPAFGVRGVLMRQKLNNSYVNNNITDNNAVTGTSTAQEFVHSWGVGPRVAVYSNWLMGARFRLYGNLATDVTFTQYNEKVNNNFTATSGVTTQNAYENYHLGMLRNHIESELGFGWGSYFDNDNWYFDLTAGYTWQVFFNQNMFRSAYASSSPARGSYDGGNLYINGLTVNVRFDF